MSEIQKIAIGLLGMSHPEIYRFKDKGPAVKPTRGSQPKGIGALLRGLKFALAALLAGARSIPLGDNGRITRELGEYGAHLKGC
ncbi:MAG TPA: hypothetical protein VGI32_08255 [Steroidobacteraceae bacterium]|jgi:hypothetical protein